ncbi:hypothetical protein STEG23_036835 [Scotinomys teguina]
MLVSLHSTMTEYMTLCMCIDMTECDSVCKCVGSCPTGNLGHLWRGGLDQGKHKPLSDVFATIEVNAADSMEMSRRKVDLRVLSGSQLSNSPPKGHRDTAVFERLEAIDLVMLN